jgi:hypothetical protein
MPIHDWTRVNAGLFHHFHQRWISALTDALNAGSLPPGYSALAEQTSGGVIPDVITLQQRPRRNVPRDGGVAVADAPPRARYVLHAPEEEVYAARADRVAIHHPLGEVVAVIEIVSPGNKSSRVALRNFVEKALDFLRQGIHLLVIDLFPPGPRDPQGVPKAIWDEVREEPFTLPPDKPLTLASYVAGPLKTAYVEPVTVGDILPEMPLFLTADVYVPAPLEATYQATWDVCPAPLKDLVMGIFPTTDTETAT